MTDKAVFEKILSVADSDDNIRAVLMEGSRANTNAVPDKWRDFDIVYVTRENAPYTDYDWVQTRFIPLFGEVAVMQIPDNGDTHDVYTNLIQFANGVRVDLTFNSIEFLSRSHILESCTVALLDKDGLFRDLPPSSERDYLPKRPTEIEFAECCNEFWWCSPYVIKALAREQMLLSLKLLDRILQEEYTKMLTWLAAANTNFAVNMGKFSTDVGKYVPKKFYKALLSSYSIAEFDAVRCAFYSLLYSFGKLAGIAIIFPVLT